MKNDEILRKINSIEASISRMLPIVKEIKRFTKDPSAPSISELKRLAHDDADFNNARDLLTHIVFDLLTSEGPINERALTTLTEAKGDKRFHLLKQSIRDRIESFLDEPSEHDSEDLAQLVRSIWDQHRAIIFESDHRFFMWRQAT